MSTGWYRWDGPDLLLQIRVQPRAGRDELVAPCGTYFKVRITAPPVEGKANRHLCRYLAKRFGVGSNAVSLVHGASGKNKQIRISAPKTVPPELDSNGCTTLSLCDNSIK